jgi:uncharacterized paraquat-inducible protein A
MTYVCENEECDSAFEEVVLEEGETAECKECKWFMTAV